MAKETQNECPIHLISNTHPLTFFKSCWRFYKNRKRTVKSSTESHKKGSQQDTIRVRKEIWSDRDVKGVTMAPGSVLMLGV